MEQSPFVTIRRDLHQIPEIGFQEFKTQQYLLTYIMNLASERMEVETWKTGIFVKIKGNNPNKVIGYRADIDGLPIIEETGLPFASTHDDYMHACGHDFHMSIGLGLLTHFVEYPIDDDWYSFFNRLRKGLAGLNRC